MSYTTGYSAERARKLLRNINYITGIKSTNITDAVKLLIGTSAKDADLASTVKIIPMYEIFSPVDAKIEIEEGS